MRLSYLSSVLAWNSASGAYRWPAQISRGHRPWADG
jgi:hypothetical protein